MRLQPAFKGLRIEAVHGYRDRQLDSVIAAAWHGQVDGGWDLCADQADGRVRCARCNLHEVGMLRLADLGQAIEDAAKHERMTAYRRLSRGRAR